MIRNIPTIACFDIEVRKRVSFFRTFRIMNRLGELLDLDQSDVIVGSVYPDYSCVCPKIFDFCVEPTGNCGEYSIMMDARQTEQLDIRWHPFFAIEVNPRPLLSEISREIKIGEFDFLGLDPDMKISDYTNYNTIEPRLPHKPTFRIAEGKIEVKA